MSSSRFSLQARWVFPVSAPPIENGVVTVVDNRIVSVGEALNREVDIAEHFFDLGNTALLPGLINAHTHLEFSHLKTPLGEPGMAFPDWIRTVIAHRRVSTTDGAESPQVRINAIRDGLAESHACGVTTIGDIATPGWAGCEYDLPPQSNAVFLELLGLADERVERLQEMATMHIAEAQSDSARWLAGLSPHAPYTASPSLVKFACEKSAKHSIPVAMHLAESWDELELLASHTGKFLDLLQEMNAWNASAVPRGIRPLDYLEMLSTAWRALVIHGNFLHEHEQHFLAQHRDRMAVVYCPRTHAYFLTEKHPLPQMLAAGVVVAVGTDSRASNPDLNLFRDLQFIARHYAEISPEVVLQLGTRNGALALGLLENRGTLEVGKRADLAVATLPDHGSNDPYELLFADDTIPSSLRRYLSVTP